MRKAFVLAAAFIAALAFNQPRARAADLPVDLQLILAVDISGSIDMDEARLQRQGYVAAIMHPRVVNAIRSGAIGRIAVAYVEWAGAELQQTVVPWTLIQDAETAAAFAARLSEAPQRTGAWTSISGAIDYSAKLFDVSGFESERKVIDVSGDGVNNSGRPIGDARAAALAKDITINGLPIVNDKPNRFGGPTPRDMQLDRYYREQVIGGPGSFLEVADDFNSFGQAILRKLIREIASLPAADIDTQLAVLPALEPATLP